jgi:hypothetical protein
MSDDQVVKRIESLQRWRRPVGICLLLLGLAALVWGYLVIRQMQEQSRTTFEELSRILKPTTQDALQSLAAAENSFDFTLGIIAGTGLAWGCGVACTGLCLIFPSRRNELLLTCWKNRTRTT